MGVRQVLARLVGDGEPTVVVECRHCGEPVGPETDACPNCGATTFAHYDIDR